MATEYSVTAGSFIRNGSYPLEADYIFPSVEALQLYCEDNEGILHDGLLKVVKTEDKQVLYWCIGTEAFPLIESDTLDNLNKVLEDFELHGTLRDLLRDLSNSINSKLRALQQELDTTQSGAGLNGDGSFDQMTMKDTTYLDGSSSIIECLKALDREMSGLVVDAFILDAYYDTDTEEIVLTFITKQDKNKTIRISMTNLIREWEPDNTKPDKVVEITREEVYGEGADKLSADVRISSRKDNILEKDGNTLVVRGTSDNITHKGLSLETVIDNIEVPDPYVFDTLDDAKKANLKLGDTFLIKNEISFKNEYHLVTSETELLDGKRYLLVYNNRALAYGLNSNGFNSTPITIIKNTTKIDLYSSANPITFHFVNQGFILETSDSKYIKHQNTTSLVNDISLASTFKVSFRTDGRFTLKYNSGPNIYSSKYLVYRSDTYFKIIDETSDSVYLYIETNPTLKGYYVVTENGFELLSFNEIVTERIDDLFSKLNRVSNSITNEIANNIIRINKITGSSGATWTPLDGSTYTNNSSNITRAIYDLDRVLASNVLYRKDVTGLQNQYTPHVNTIIENADSLHKADKILADTVETTVTDISLKTADTYTPESADTYTITKVNGDTKDVQLTFTPLSPSTLTVPETIGDITLGTTAESLKGKPISEILDSILFKTIYPTITEPTISISAGSTNVTYEAGHDILTNSAFTYSFNLGSVVVNDGVTPNKVYVGAVNGNPNYIVKVTGGVANTNAGVSSYPNLADSAINSITRYNPGTYQYKVSVNYNAGPVITTSKGASLNPMPTTNKGNVVNPHPAGTITSSYGVTVNISLPLYVDVANGTYSKRNLAKWGPMTYTGVTMQSTSKENPIKILTPRKLLSVNSINEVSGKYDVPQLGLFVMTSITKDINGANYPYYEYIWNGGAQGAVNMEIKTY